MRISDRKFLAILALFLTIGVTFTVVDSNNDGKPDEVTVQVGGGKTVTFDKDNNLDPQQQKDEGKDVKDGVQGELQGPQVEVESHEDLRDEHPPGVPEASVDRGLAQKTAPGKGEAVELGGAQNYSCAYRPVKNFSSRNGQKVLLFTLHYTVSPFGSLPEIWAQFNTPSSGTSSTLGLEVNGTCLQFMPFSAKPWTQLTFNGRSESVEIVAPGDLAREVWLSKPIFTKGILASLVYDRLRANGLPIRLVDPVGCGVQAAGYTDHNRLECGNNHTDVGTHFPFDVLNQQLKVLSLGLPIGGGQAPPSEAAIRYCKTLVRVRRLNRPPNPPSATQSQRKAAKKARLKLAKKYRCGERSNRVFIERR